MQTDQSSTPGVLGSNEGLGLEPERDAAAVARAMEYYRAGLERRRPAWVPSRVFLHGQVRSDFPWERGYVADRGEHDCESNQWGALSVRAKNGKMLGIKPAEFEPLAWKPNVGDERRL